MILKCVARCRCSGKVAQKKVDCLYILERNSSSLLHLLRIMSDVFIVMFSMLIRTGLSGLTSVLHNSSVK